MKRFLIEREIPQVGTLNREQLQTAAGKSNDALRQLGTDIQWIESFVTDDKTFCIYLAKDEDIIERHAEISAMAIWRRIGMMKTLLRLTVSVYSAPKNL